MKKSAALFIALITLCLLLPLAASAKPKKPSAPKPLAKHVVLIGLDGWGSFSMPDAVMPNVRREMRRGAYTLTKRAVLPSSSAVNWATMFMGATPELHGYTSWGSRTPEIPSRELTPNGIFPNIFHLLRTSQPKAEIGVYHDWDGIRHLVDTLSLSRCIQGPDYNKQPSALTDQAEEYILKSKPNLLAVIYDNPDHTAHHHGFQSPAYYRKLSELDGYIGRIVAATKKAGIYDDTIFIITSDHGGNGATHGGLTLNEIETPFIISGKNIRSIGQFPESMMQFDVAAVIARIFGLTPPQVWVGRSLPHLFKD